MRYDFSLPAGWTAMKLPEGGRGLVLQAPVAADPSERAALFLLDPLTPQGTLAEQLAAAVGTSLSTVEVVKRGTAQPLAGAAYPGLLLPARVRVPKPATTAGTQEAGGEVEKQDEGRLYFLLETPSARLLVVFVGGQKALPRYQPVVDAFLRSIHPAGDGPAGDGSDSAGSPSPYGSWGE